MTVVYHLTSESTLGQAIRALRRQGFRVTAPSRDRRRTHALCVSRLDRRDEASLKRAVLEIDPQAKSDLPQPTSAN